MESQAGEEIDEDAEGTYSRCGEGRGFTSNIYQLKFGQKSFVVKVRASVIFFSGKDVWRKTYHSLILLPKTTQKIFVEKKRI